MSAPARAQFEEMGFSSPCAEVLQHLWDYLDEQITSDSARRLDAHIATCRTCQEYRAYQACFLESLAKLHAELTAPHTLRERLAEGLKESGCGCWEKVRRS